MSTGVAIVIGATGLVGTLVVKKLVSEGTFRQVIAIARAKESSTDLIFRNPKVQLICFDFQNWNELELQICSFIGAARVGLASFFCCLGTTIHRAGSPEAFRKIDHDYVVSFARLAKNTGAAQLLIISALGANRSSKTLYARTKGEMESAVQLEFPGKLHFLRPSLLLGDRKDFRLFERVAILLAPLYSPLLIGRWKIFRPVPAEKVAETMILLATKKIAGGIVLENTAILEV